MLVADTDVDFSKLEDGRHHNGDGVQVRGQPDDLWHRSDCVHDILSLAPGHYLRSFHWLLDGARWIGDVVLVCLRVRRIWLLQKDSQEEPRIGQPVLRQYGHIRRSLRQLLPCDRVSSDQGVIH